MLNGVTFWLCRSPVQTACASPPGFLPANLCSACSEPLIFAQPDLSPESLYLEVKLALFSARSRSAGEPPDPATETTGCCSMLGCNLSVTGTATADAAV